MVTAKTMKATKYAFLISSVAPVEIIISFNRSGVNECAPKRWSLGCENREALEVRY